LFSTSVGIGPDGGEEPNLTSRSEAAARDQGRSPPRIADAPPRGGDLVVV